VRFVNDCQKYSTMPTASKCHPHERSTRRCIKTSSSEFSLRDSFLDFWIISNFRKIYLKSLEDLFALMLDLCIEVDLAKLGRSSGVEPLHDQIKDNRGFNQISLRGFSKGKSVWIFICTIHNVHEFLRHTTQMPL
jgi:hypothetical protein